ncbi:MAG: PAS domain S-box protein, partial [Thermodesulfobacteriota bacterium]|nr:PAS domain S-box protein [Thermodesulfobacteriota bacterium]
RHDKEWEKINKADSGQFIARTELISFITVRPFSDEWYSTNVSKSSSEQIRENKYYWKIINRTPFLSLEKNSLKYLINILIQYPQYYLILAIACLLYAFFRLTKEKTEQELAKLYQAINHSPTSIFITDLDGNIEYVNPMFEHLTGYTFDEAMGKNPRILQSGEHSRAFYKEMWGTVLRGNVWRGEIKNKKKNGEIFWEHASMSPVFDNNNKIISIIAVKEDITEQRKTEAALKLSEERYALALKAGNLGIWDWNIATGNIDRSKNVSTFFGFKESDSAVTFQSFLQCIYPEDQQLVKNSLKDAVHKNHDYNIEHRIVFPDGITQRWISAMGEVHRDEHGTAARMVGTVRDITEKKLLDIRIEHLASFPDDNPDPVIEIDQYCKITYQNPAAMDKFPGEWKFYYEHPLFKSIFIKGCAQNNLHDCIYLREHRICPYLTDLFNQKDLNHNIFSDEISIDERIFHQKVKIISNSQIMRIFAFDITERKQREKELKNARNEAENANKFKDMFLANISHELRTPMNAILGYTDILFRKEKDVNKIEKLEIIKTSGTRLLHLINELLDFSKLKADKVEILSKPFLLRDLIKDVYLLFKHQANEKGLIFKFEVGDSVPEIIKGDESRISQILINLIGNSIKFTNSGMVSLDCNCSMDNITFIIKDTGIGMSKEQMQYIFKPFIQADSSTVKKYGGTGLGLAISRTLIELMDGSITLSSIPDSGSTFTIELPLLSVDPALEDFSDIMEKRAEKMVKRWLRGKEDSLDISTHIRMCLKNIPAKLDKLKTAVEQNNKQDIGFLIHDIKGVTGNLGMTEIYDIAKELHQGFEKHELDMDNIKAKINQIELIVNSIPDKYSKYDTGKPALQNPITAEKMDFRILLAEDNKVNQKLVKDMLEETGVDITIAENGKIAIDMLLSQGYDLLLLDMQMPIMDGMETITRIRADENLKHLFVIALTANAVKGSAAKYINAGCDDYLSKPISFKILKKKIMVRIAEKTEKKEIRNISNHNKVGAQSLQPVKVTVEAGSIITSALKGLRKSLKFFNPEQIKKISGSLDDISELQGISNIQKDLAFIVRTFNDQGLNEVIDRLEGFQWKKS